MIESTALTCARKFVKRDALLGYSSVSQAYNYSQYRPEYPEKMIQILNTCAYGM